MEALGAFARADAAVLVAFDRFFLDDCWWLEQRGWISSGFSCRSRSLQFSYLRKRTTRHASEVHTWCAVLISSLVDCHKGGRVTEHVYLCVVQCSDTRQKGKYFVDCLSCCSSNALIFYMNIDFQLGEHTELHKISTPEHYIFIEGSVQIWVDIIRYIDGEEVLDSQLDGSVE